MDLGRFWDDDGDASWDALGSSTVILGRPWGRLRDALVSGTGLGRQWETPVGRVGRFWDIVCPKYVSCGRWQDNDSACQRFARETGLVICVSRGFAFRGKDSITLGAEHIRRY